MRALAASQPPVILVSIDTLRADHLSAYGYSKIRTPNIDAFADHGTVFRAIDSQIPLTLPSHTCLFTSTYPFENGVEENAEIVPAGLVTLASVLQRRGYRTGAFVGSDLLGQRYGLDKGFDVYDSPFRASANEAENPYDVRVRRDAALVVRSAIQWLNTPSAKPPFAFLHFFDLHSPYSAASPNKLQPNEVGYDAEIEYVDRVMSRLRNELVKSGIWDRALVVVLADHGESLSDHGETSHGYFIYQSTLWVPLLIHWPADAQAMPAEVSEPAGLIDVAPTILDFLHVPQPGTFRGISLLKTGARHSVYSETVYARDAFGWSALRSLRAGPFKYIDAPAAELYDIKTNPREDKNAIQSHFAEARTLRNELRGLLANAAKPTAAVKQDSSAATVNSLRSLGYLTGGSHEAVSGGGPDPKSRLPEYQAYERGLEALYDHRESQAVTIFQEVIARDSQNNIARYYLGEAYLRLQRRDDAIREWKAALRQDPKYAAAAEAIQKVSH